MRILDTIEQVDVIEKILKHLGVWLPNRSSPPRANSPPEGIVIDYLIDPDRSTLRFSTGYAGENLKMVFGSAGKVHAKMPENGVFCDHQPAAQEKSKG